jgi:hypothetical protein
MIVVIIETLLFLSIGFFVILLLRKALKKAKIETVEEEAKDLKLQVLRVKNIDIKEYKANKKEIDRLFKKMEE